MFQQKHFTEIIFQDTERRWKVKGKLSPSWKNDIRSLVMPPIESLKICFLKGFFCPEHIKFYMKKYRGAMCHEIEGWCSVCSKISWWFEKDIRNFIDFDASSRKSKNVLFDRLLLSRGYKFLDEIVQKSHVSWQ